MLHIASRLRGPFAAAATACASSSYYFAVYSDASPKAGLDPKTFTPLKLEKVTPLSHNTAIYRFAFDDAEAPSGLTVASCLVTKAPIGSEKEDGSRANVIRPYTPISRPNEKGYIDLAVKSYPEGKMSKHISSLKVGDTLDFKGPIVKLPYKPSEFKEIGMIAGGTGIAPMLQVADEILENPADTTKVSLVFANVSEDDILMKARIDSRAAKHPDRFKVYYVVDKTDSAGWKGGTGYITEAMIGEHIPAPASTSMVYVCGPPPMYKAICGPKGTKEDPKAQGELGGVLKNMGYESSNVFKF